MTQINSTGKVAYMYDEETDTWYAISGQINTAAAYSWTATQTFNNPLIANDVINAKAGVNNFLNPSTRDSAMPSIPARGTVCFIRNTNSGSTLNQLQFFDGTSWRNYEDSVFLSSSTETITLALEDAGQTILADSSDEISINIPTNSSVAFPVGTRLEVLRLGTGDVVFVPPAGVTLNSKNSNKKIASRWSGASLTKINTNTWVLIGDLTA